MKNHPRKQVDARAKQDPHERARQLIREWCDEQFDRMMAEMPDSKAGTDPPHGTDEEEKGDGDQTEGDTKAA